MHLLLLINCIFISATGEPPLNLSCSAAFAIRNALKSARKDAGKEEDWFEIGNLFSLFL